MIWKFSEGVQNIMWVSIHHLIKLSNPQIILQTSSWRAWKAHLESSPHKTFQPMDFSTNASSWHTWKTHLEPPHHKTYQTTVYFTALPSRKTVSTHTATTIITHCLTHSTNHYVFHFFVKISNPRMILPPGKLLWNHHLVKPTKSHLILQL